MKDKTPWWVKSVYSQHMPSFLYFYLDHFAMGLGRTSSDDYFCSRETLWAIREKLTDDPRRTG